MPHIILMSQWHCLFSSTSFFTDSEPRQAKGHMLPHTEALQIRHILCYPQHSSIKCHLWNKVTSSTNSASSKTTATTPLFRPLHGSSEYCTSPWRLQAPSPKLRSLPWHCSIEPSVHLEGTTVLTQISILKTGI